MELDIYTLAHEIKNPLSIAKGYLEMSDCSNFLQNKDLINSNIMEAISILDGYLEYKKLSINCEIMDILLLIEEVKNNYTNLYNIKIDIISMYEELFINADYFKLKQVFNNLIKNSVEAKSKEIQVYIKLHNNEIIINFVDDGIGFNNINNLVGYSQKINGNGIGLLLTEKILKMHNGNIEYNNNEKKGCNISIKLPINL